jgi:hypothetical protein
VAATPRRIIDRKSDTGGAFITSSVFDVLGSAPRSFRRWVTDHATGFIEGPPS